MVKLIDFAVRLPGSARTPENQIVRIYLWKCAIDYQGMPCSVCGKRILFNHSFILNGNPANPELDNYQYLKERAMCKQCAGYEQVPNQLEP